MNKLYDRIDFQNNSTPALNETNLNAMSKGIDDIDDRVVTLGTAVLETIPELEDLKERIEENIDNIEQAGAKALIAEGYSVGKQNGQDVPSSSPYYHNNAKYYSGLSNPTALANMSDVDVSGASNGKILKYNGTSQKWEAGEGGSGSPSAESVTYDNTSTQMSATNVQDAIDEVFQSVSNGKELIADAISDKGVTTSASATFSVMAQNIEAIPTGTDVSDTTATASDVSTGKIFHLADGSRATGTLGRTKTGSFTLTSSDQTISCGFQPSQVTVYEGIGTSSNWGIGTIVNGTNYGLRYGTSASTNQSPCTITLTSTGFKVKSNNSSYNKSCTYIAIE